MMTPQQIAHVRADIEQRSHKRQTFGKLCKTEAAAQRKEALARRNGWNDLKVEIVNLGGRDFWKVTGVRPAYRILQELTGTVEGVNAPRVENEKFRHKDRYRHGS